LLLYKCCEGFVVTNLAATQKCCCCCCACIIQDEDDKDDEKADEAAAADKEKDKEAAAAADKPAEEGEGKQLEEGEIPPTPPTAKQVRLQCLQCS
jgi:hypothetical protein